MSKLQTFTLPFASSLLLVGLVGCGRSFTETDETDAGVTAENDCDDNEDNDNDGDEDCEDSDCASDDDCAPEYFTPDAFLVNGDFVFNKEANEIRQIGFADGSVVGPTVLITLATEDYFQTGDETQKCDVLLTYSGTTPLVPQLWDFTEEYKDGSGATRTARTIHSGFKLPDSDVTVVTNCTAEEGFELDPQWGTVEDVASWTWGVGVGNFRPDVSDALDDQEGFESLAGGGMFWNAAADPANVNMPGYLSVGYAFGFAIDESGTVTADAEGNGTLLDPADIVTDDGVPPTAYYRVFSAYGFDASYLIP